MSASIFTVISNSLIFRINPPENTYVGLYRISVKAYDDFGGETLLIKTIDVKENYPPVLVSLQLSLNLYVSNKF